MTRLVAFLRGVNLGRRKVKMDALRESFANAGFPGARTLLASGNVVFDGEKGHETVTRIESRLEADFGFPVETIIRSMDYLRDMVISEPFAGFEPDADTKFYVFLLGHDQADKFTGPFSVPGDFEIARIDRAEIYAVGYRMPNGRFGEGLDAIGKPFGRYVTNRNWNTVLRLIEMEKK